MNNPATARRWRWMLPVLQVVALVGAAVYMARAIRSYGPMLTRTPITLSWGPLILASVVWYASFIQLVQSWTASLVWWGWRLRWGVGLRVFFFSNLARYIPGGIWQFAGLAALAMDAGGSPLDASAAVLLLQLVLLITGLLITFSAAPATLGPRVAALSGVIRPLIAGVAAVAIVAGAPRAAPVLRRFAERILRRSVPLPIPAAWPFVLYFGRAALAWVGYGVSFWLFSRAVFGPTMPSVWYMGSAYVASYLLGMIAVFAPGGLVVREAALVVALRGAIGAERALILALGCRLWLVALEVLGALVLLGIDRLRVPGRSA